jgi:hypothetical protein
MAFYLADKHLYNVALANGGLNGMNATAPGQFSTDTRLPFTSFGSFEDVGKRIWVEAPNIGLVQVTANGTLFGGYYQLVQVDSTALASNVAVGRVAYIKNTAAGNAAFQVTDESVATANTEVAGIFLNTVTPGNYTFICIGGKVNVRLKATISNGSPLEGDSLFSGGGSGTVDDLATGVTWATSLLGRYLGNALAVPASATTIAMQIRGTLGIY